MRNLLNNKVGIWTAVMLLFISFTACKKEKAFTPDIVVGITDSSMSVPNSGGEQNIEFVSNVPWQATTDVDWIQIETDSGDKGMTNLRFTVDRNTEDERSGMVAISSTNGELSKKILIVQETGKTDDFYVKVGASGAGHSWDDATDLATAIKKSVSGSVISVAAGTYHPSATITGGDPANKGDITFEISNNITLIGGFPANATQGATADPETNKTILSGDLGNGDTAYHVITVTAPKVAGQKVTIEGLTITDGSAAAKSSGSPKVNGTTVYRNDGAGINIINAVVEINNCEIIENHSKSGASALFVYSGADVSVSDTKINDNKGHGNGGVIWVYTAAELNMYNSEVIDNSTTGVAGAFYVYKNCTLNLYNTVVKGNSSTSFGAAVYLRAQSTGALVNCLITGNSSTSTHGGGGLMMYDNCDVAIVSSTITANTIAGPGGGIYRAKNSNNLHIYNSIISGNTQANGTLDVDDDGNQPDIDFASSVVGSKVYNASGNQTSATFDPGTMLNAQFMPIGNPNPALTGGMDASAITAAASAINPPLESVYLSEDLNENSRSDKTIMGSFVQ